MARIRLPYIPLPQSAVTQSQIRVSDSLSRLLRGNPIESEALGFSPSSKTKSGTAASNLGLDGPPVALPPGPPEGFCAPRRSQASRDLQYKFEQCIRRGDTEGAYSLWVGGQSKDTTASKMTLFPPPNSELPLTSTFKLLNMLEKTDPDSPLLYGICKSVITSTDQGSIFAPAIFRVFLNLFKRKQYSQIVGLWTDYVNSGCLIGTRTSDYKKFVTVVAPAFILEEFESRGSREGAARDLIELLGPEAPVIPTDKMEKMIKKMLSKDDLNTLSPKYMFFLDVQKTHDKQKSIFNHVQKAVEMKSAHQLNYWWHVAMKSSRELLTLEHCQAFISAFSALKSSAGAFQVWEFMEGSAVGLQPSRECWEALLEASSHVTTSQSQFFQQAWDGMVLAGYVPSPHCFALKFRWLKRNRMFMSADELFGDILAVPSESQTGDLPELTQEILEAYIPCLLAKKRHQEAEQLVQLLTPRDSINLSFGLSKTFVEFYLKHKFVDSIPKWLSKMEQQGLFTTPESFALLLAYNVLYITEVSPERNMHPVLKQIYTQMEVQGIPLNQTTFARLIAEVYRVCPQLPASRAIFDSLIRAEIVPNEEVIMAVLRGECSTRGDVLLGQELLHSMVSMTSNRQFLKPQYWNYLLRALLKQKKQAEALVSFNKMKSCGVPISAHTYALLLEGLRDDFSDVKQSILNQLMAVKEPHKTYLMTDRLKSVIRDLKNKNYSIGSLLNTNAPPRWK